MGPVVGEVRTHRRWHDRRAGIFVVYGGEDVNHALAVSLGPEVRVNSISPGWIEVRNWQKASRMQTPDLTPADHAQHPSGRVGEPKDVAALARFLLSAEAGFITGQNFVVDGGMTEKMIYLDD